MNDLLYTVYLMMMANPAPSSIPGPLLHFNLDPRMHRFVALRMAKDIRACTHPITSLQGFCHFIASFSATRFINTLASQPIRPSTDSTKGEKDACRAIAASLYFLFSLSADASTASTEHWAWDWASVSVTCMSNNASVWGCHTPLTPRSATKAGRFLVLSGSFTTGSFVTSL